MYFSHHHTTTKCFLLMILVMLSLYMSNVLAEPPLKPHERVLININTASAEELSELKGIGLKKAEKIIEERNTNGPFNTLEEITRVKGIGNKLLQENIHLLAIE